MTDPDPDELPLYATPEGQTELDRWRQEDPEAYSQWLDDEWARDHPEDP